MVRSEVSEDVGEAPSSSEKAIGRLVLLTVPLSWGTYGPVVRYLYEIQPPVPGFLFSAAYYSLASITLLALFWGQEARSKPSETAPTGRTFPMLAGLELGTYLFLGNGLQVLGLKTVPSDRAGFLVQLTTVMVPIVQAAFSGDLRSIPLPTWFACILAFGGVVVMGMDGNEILQDDGIISMLTSVGSSFTQGDCLIVAAAFVYTLHVVRLGRYAKETTPLQLAASKATIEAILSTALVTGLWWVGNSAVDGAGLVGFAQETGREITNFVTSLAEGIPSGDIPPSVLIPAVCATFWTAWVTCAYTIYAQSFGQRRIDPTDANLIYTAQPICTALFAWILLGETLGPAGFVGGGMIGSAVYLVAAMDQKEESPV